MLGKAHLTIGIASALTLMMPDNMPAALPVVTGAAAGCLMCDIDCDSPREKSDASRYRKLAALIVFIALLEDHRISGGMWAAAWERGAYMVCGGIAGFALTMTFANVSMHRGFSHSLLAMVLEAGFLWMIFPQAALPFLIAFSTHLVLDLTNKKPVRLFYPLKKGVCLGLFYADRLADKVCAVIGTVWLLIWILTRVL